MKYSFKQLHQSLLKIIDIFGPFPLGVRVLNSLNIPLSVETVCVFTAPIFSAFASWATYLLTKVCPCQNYVLYISAILCVQEFTAAASFCRRLRVLGLAWQQRLFWLWWVYQQPLLLIHHPVSLLIIINISLLFVMN